MKNKNQKVTFRRIRGRLVPIRVSNEVASVKESLRQGSKIGAFGGIAAGVGGGLAAAYGAGRLEKASQALKFGKKATLLNKTAKVLKFGGKWGAALAVGQQISRIDLANKKDENAQLTNLGSGGSLAMPARLALIGLSAYAGGRAFKRFEKWGLRGGKFPVKLRDI